MSKKVNHEQIRYELINAAVRAGARYGLSGITNTVVGEISGRKEPYIYRYFIDRDDLIEKAFFSCDENFFTVVENSAPILSDTGIPKGTHRFAFFDALLDYSIRDTDYTKFYIRYYYSPMFGSEQREKHMAICDRHFEPFSGMFLPEVDREFLLHQIFALFLSSVMDIAMNPSKNTPENRDKIVKNMSLMAEPFLKSGELP